MRTTNDLSRISESSQNLMAAIFSSLEKAGSASAAEEPQPIDDQAEQAQAAPSTSPTPPARRKPGRPPKKKPVDKSHGKVHTPKNVTTIADLPTYEDTGGLGLFTDGLPVEQVKAAVGRALSENRKAPTETIDQKLHRMRGLTSGRISAYLEEETRLAEAAAKADRAAQQTLMADLIREFEAEGHDPERVEALKKATAVALSDDPDAHTADGTVREVVTIVGNQPSQTAFLKDMEPGSVLAQGGWGSGKSWSGARKFAFLHALNTESEGMIIAPTREDLVRDIIPKFMEFCEELNWPVIRKEQPLRLKVLGRTIHCMSAEEPRRISAFTVGHGWVDEAARVRESKSDPLDDAPTQIRGRMRCKKAKILQLIVTTTPEGVNTWVQRDWIDEKTKKPNHRAYFLQTMQNSALHTEYVKDLMATIPADLVDQYLSGHAVDFVAERAHATFTLENHSAIELDHRLPLHIGMDFNVDPMSWVAVQLHDDQIHVVDEVFITKGTTVDVAFTTAAERGWFKCPRIIYHPDKSSKARSTTGEGEFATVQALTRKLGVPFTGTAMGNNPPILSRIGKVSRAILSADGQRRLKINDKTCPRAILEMRTTGRKSDGAYDPGKEGDKGHLLDALGYVIYDVMPDITSAAGTFAFKY